ncbi:MAG: hypothetical protein FWD61_06675, partial [Phycisphaerales bacterium]|nr:hypothetical protein [Phycisphaerales bacterium]
NPPPFGHQSRDRKGATGFISALSHGSLPYGRGSDRGLRQSTLNHIAPALAGICSDERQYSEIPNRESEANPG